MRARRPRQVKDAPPRRQLRAPGGGRTIGGVTDAAPRRRKGLGCLPGLALLLVLAAVGMMALDLVFYPWIYVVGGRVRPLPVWQGVGEAQGPGGAYRLFVWFSPTKEGTSVMPVTSIDGAGYLCTPAGERIGLRIGGGASGQVWKNMDGHEFHLYLQRPRSAAEQFNGRYSSPSFTLRGRWDGPDLALDDRAGLARTFSPDGTLRARPGDWNPRATPAPLRLTERAWWPWGAKCPKALRP